MKATATAGAAKTLSQTNHRIWNLRKSLPNNYYDHLSIIFYELIFYKSQLNYFVWNYKLIMDKINNIQIRKNRFRISSVSHKNNVIKNTILNDDN